MKDNCDLEGPPANNVMAGTGRESPRTPYNPPKSCDSPPDSVHVNHPTADTSTVQSTFGAHVNCPERNNLLLSRPYAIFWLVVPVVCDYHQELPEYVFYLVPNHSSVADLLNSCGGGWMWG
eukprot:TRINITY_DN1553_c0_g1_i1.p1 TRINITY_DN1553_c0_g1~~TRINITY_DN1553_c0_g1_i1.p1  ORF type:complete len:121 (+),score=17.23 TRINITY_DN1553_c0_g1_i1:365-727(+)